MAITVTNQGQLQAAIASGAHIVLVNDVTLTTAMIVAPGITGLKISSQKGDGSNAVLKGGGSTRLLTVGSGAAIVIEGVDFEDGSAGGGGCVHNDGGDLQIQASNFRGCVAIVSWTWRVEEGRPTTTTHATTHLTHITKTNKPRHTLAAHLTCVRARCVNELTLQPSTHLHSPADLPDHARPPAAWTAPVGHHHDHDDDRTRLRMLRPTWGWGNTRLAPALAYIPTHAASCVRGPLGARLLNFNGAAGGEYGGGRWRRAGPCPSIHDHRHTSHLTPT